MKSLINSKIVALNNLEGFAKELLDSLPKSAIVLLNGNLAAGKTTLVKSIVEQIGESGAVTSPTFSLQQRYGESLFHYDFYRVEFDDLEDLGLLEEFEKEGLHFIEWANEDLVNLLKDAGFSIYSISIMPVDNGAAREYKMEVISA